MSSMSLIALVNYQQNVLGDQGACASERTLPGLEGLGPEQVVPNS